MKPKHQIISHMINQLRLTSEKKYKKILPHTVERLLWQDEITEMKRKLRIMSHQIDQLKEEIQAKEALLVKEHLDHQRVEKEKETLKTELQKMKQLAGTLVVDWLIDWWTDWLIDWIIDWLIDLLVDWLIDQ